MSVETELPRGISMLVDLIDDDMPSFLNPKPSETWALAAQLLHNTLVSEKPRHLWQIWSARPYGTLFDAKEILVAAFILQELGKLRLDKPVEAVAWTQADGFSIGDHEVVWFDSSVPDIFAGFRVAVDIALAYRHQHKIAEAEHAIVRCDEQVADAQKRKVEWQEHLKKLKERQS